MRNGKKIVHLILAFFMLILSLGTATGCVFDPEINVKRVNNDVYIYNGERYIHTAAMDEYFSNKSYLSNVVGYTYNGIGQKYAVTISGRDIDENVIELQGDYYFRFLCHKFYVKESTSFPTSLWEAKFSSIALGTGDEIEISFQLKNVLAKSPSYQDLSGRETETIYCYLENFHPMCKQLFVSLDSQNDMFLEIYDNGYYIGYKVTDKDFKVAVMQIAFD